MGTHSSATAADYGHGPEVVFERDLGDLVDLGDRGALPEGRGVHWRCPRPGAGADCRASSPTAYRGLSPHARCDLSFTAATSSTTTRASTTTVRAPPTAWPRWSRSVRSPRQRSDLRHPGW